MSGELSVEMTSNDYNISTNDSNIFTNSSYLTELLKILREKHNKPISAEEMFRNVIIIICYSLIVVVSLCGNSLVLKVIVFGKKKMWTTTNILIASLAFSDVVMTAFNIPFNVARLLLESWPFGSFLCVSVPFVQVTCVYVSTFTMTVIAYYRYYSVTRTRSTKSLSLTQLSIVIGLIWIFAALFAIPHSVFNKTIVIPKIQNLVRCFVIHPKFEFDFSFWLSLETFITQYLIPLSITIWLYIKLGYIVSKQGTIAGQSTEERKRIQSEARKRRLIMLALVVIVFAFCWLFLNLYHLLVDFQLINRNFKIFILCHWFAMSSVCYNPLIYCSLNSSYRNDAKKLFKFLLCQTQTTVEDVIEEQINPFTNTTNVNCIELTQIANNEYSD